LEVRKRRRTLMRIKEGEERVVKNLLVKNQVNRQRGEVEGEEMRIFV
jgi:hypothetical protein